MSDLTIAQKLNNMARKGENEGIPMVCNHCGYYWYYTGSLQNATCPSCSGKVNVDENRQDSIRK